MLPSLSMDPSPPPSATNSSAPLDRSHRLWTVSLRGILVGASDLIPGVSGGTMALILGIYDRLIAALASLTSPALWSSIRRRDLRSAWSIADGGFLVSLGAGIAAALLTLSSLLSFLLDSYPSQLYAVFFGLIGVSVVLVLSRVTVRRRVAVASMVPAAVFAFWLSSSIPVTLPGSPLVLMGSGMLAVSALLLPGVSGAFVLVLLGQYARVLEAVSALDLSILLPFAVGMVIGGLLFSRVLATILVRFHAAAHGALAGFLLGSLRKVWPWQEEIAGSSQILFPATLEDASVAFLLAATAVGLVILLERSASRSRRATPSR